MSSSKDQYTPQEIREMSAEDRQKLEERVKQGETVVEGGTGGKTLEAQIHLKEGRTKGGLSTTEESGEERAQQPGVDPGAFKGDTTNQ